MVSVITFFVYLSTYYFTTIQNMQTDNERYKKMASLAQIGWWEVDLTAGYYLCSDYLSDLLGLDGDTISTSDFLNLIREDYRKQIAQEFRANSSIHKDFYEQTFPIHSKYGEVWLHTRLAFREKGTGVDGGDKSFGIIQRVEAPKEEDQRDALRRVNDLLCRQNFVSQSLLRFLRDEAVESCIADILRDILNLYNGKGRVYIFEYDEIYANHSCIYEVVSEGVSAEIDNLQDMPASESKWWSEQILSGKPIILNTLEQLLEEAPDEYQILVVQGIKSLMVTPLMTGDRVWGYMGIDLVETYHDWSNEDFQWFSSLGNIINICIELRKTKDKVIREQTFLNNLFHFMPMGYIRMSIIRDENNKPCDYRVTDANEVSSTFFGLPLESYIGSLASEKHPDYLQKLNFLEEILDSNSYREKDEYFPRTERYTHWVIYSPGKDEIVGLFLDSTGSVQANRALDRSEKLFQNIFANIPAGVEIYDKDGYLIDLNNKDLEIFGVVNKSDVIGVNFFENPNVPQGIRDRVRNEDLVDFRLNYSFEQAEGYYETNRSNAIELYSKVSKLYDNEAHMLKVLDVILNKSYHKLGFQNGKGKTYEALLTTSSIPLAQKYYELLTKVKEGNTPLRIDEKIRQVLPDFPKFAITYSVTENEEGSQVNQQKMQKSLDDYNNMFGTKFDLAQIQSYNGNLNKRLARKDPKFKRRHEQLDLVIVVDRLLTGFDAPCMSTMFIDRQPMGPHDLIQAFSRTNRIFDKNKTYGQIVTFQAPKLFKESVDNAVKLYSAGGTNDSILAEWDEVEKAFCTALKALRIAAGAPTAIPGMSLAEKKVFAKIFQTFDRLFAQLKSFSNYSDKLLEEYDITEEEYEDYVAHYKNVIEEIKREKEEGNDGGEDEEETSDLDSEYELMAYSNTKIDYEYIINLIQNIVSPGEDEEDISPEERQKQIDEVKQYIAELRNGNPKMADIMSNLVSEIEVDADRYKGHSILNIVETTKQKYIENRISDFCEKWYAEPDDVMYAAMHYRNDEIPNEGVIKATIDYTCYKANAEKAVPKFKYYKMCMDELKEVLDTEIKPLINPL